VQRSTKSSSSILHGGRSGAFAAKPLIKRRLDVENWLTTASFELFLTNSVGLG